MFPIIDTHARTEHGGYNDDIAAKQLIIARPFRLGRDENRIFFFRFLQVASVVQIRPTVRAHVYAQ